VLPGRFGPSIEDKLGMQAGLRITEGVEWLVFGEGVKEMRGRFGILRSERGDFHRLAVGVLEGGVEKTAFPVRVR